LCLKLQQLQNIHGTNQMAYIDSFESVMQLGF